MVSAYVAERNHTIELPKLTNEPSTTDGGNGVFQNVEKFLNN